MNLEVVIIGAVIGGLVGFISALINKKKGKKTQSNKVVLVIIIAVAVAIQVTMSNPKTRIQVLSIFNEDYAKMESMKLKLNSFLEIKEVKDKLKTITSPAEAKNYTLRLVRSGLKRLSIEELKEWNKVRINIMEKSPLTCAGFWTGIIDEDEFLKTMSYLDEEDIDFWVSMSKSAARKEIAQSDYLKTDQSDFKKGYMGIRELQSTDEQFKMDRILRTGASVPNEDACWIMKKILPNISKLKPESQKRFLIYLASL